jgi:hypothetical protein
MVPVGHSRLVVVRQRLDRQLGDKLPWAVQIQVLPIHGVTGFMRNAQQLQADHPAFQLVLAQQVDQLNLSRQ